jgi:protein-L-isoaspartate(D-aspartate) O-methyltransferase
MKPIVFTLLVCFFLYPGLVTAQNDYQNERNRMVDRQIANRGISDEATLEAMRTVKRHLFVPAQRISQAYDDSPLPIGYGQTISQPYIVALMTELVEPKPGMRVLEIGTGSGYQAAVLAEIVDTVYTIEIVEQLGITAAGVLEENGYGNVLVKLADGYHGWEEYAPFDAIVVTAAAEHIPPPLIQQLAPGGKMIIPVGSPYFTQNLMLVEKDGDSVRSRNILPVRFVPFTRAEQ